MVLGLILEWYHWFDLIRGHLLGAVLSKFQKAGPRTGLLQVPELACT